VTIAQVHLFFFRLPLVRPLTLKGSTLIHREGYIIRLRDHDGFTGWGEISPLPGFSRESSADAQNQFASIRNQLTGHPVPDSLEKLSGGFQRWLGGLNLFPSVRFGVETTVLNLLATHSAIPLHTLLNSASPSVVSVNALLTGSTDDILKHAEQMRKEGYRAVKLKVGHLSVHDGIRLTKSVYERLGSVTIGSMPTVRGISTKRSHSPMASPAATSNMSKSLVKITMTLLSSPSAPACLSHSMSH